MYIDNETAKAIDKVNDVLKQFAVGDYVRYLHYSNEYYRCLSKVYRIVSIEQGVYVVKKFLFAQRVELLNPPSLKVEILQQKRGFSLGWCGPEGDRGEIKELISFKPGEYGESLYFHKVYAKPTIDPFYTACDRRYTDEYGRTIHADRELNADCLEKISELEARIESKYY